MSRAERVIFAPVPFFIEDFNNTDDLTTAASDLVRLAMTPNADAARAAFCANLVNISTETFGSFLAETTPRMLTIEADMAVKYRGRSTGSW